MGIASVVKNAGRMGMKDFKSKGAGAIGIGTVVNGGFFLGDMKQYKEQGDTTGKSIMKAGAMTAFRSTMPITAGITELTPVAIELTKAYNGFREKGAQKVWNMHNPGNTVGGGYNPVNARANTMRQVAVEQIQGNKLNARSALGGEARIYSPYNNRKF